MTTDCHVMTEKLSKATFSLAMIKKQQRRIDACELYYSTIRRCKLYAQADFIQIQL